MIFVYNNIPHLLLLIGVLCLFYWWSFKKRQRLTERFTRKEFLGELAPSYSKRKTRLKSFLSIVVIVFSVLSLMRPQWGFQWKEVKRKGLDILVAIDTSKSMLAEDVKPNRLERSKLALKDLVKKLRGDRIGLIAFSGRAFLQCPLTVDYSGFILSLNDINVGTIPRGGTSISSAINEAIESYEGEQKKYKVLIIITDGENHEGDPLRVTELAKKEGITDGEAMKRLSADYGNGAKVHSRGNTKPVASRDDSPMVMYLCGERKIGKATVEAALQRKNIY